MNDMMEQRSDDWWKARCGKITASRIVDVMAQGKGVTRANYMAQIVAERLTGEVDESYTNPHMERGKELEEDAKREYEFMFDAVPAPMDAFVQHPEIERAGASPDMANGTLGLVEFKCPMSKTHLNTLESRKVERKYRLQMQWQMACTEREFVHFCSYDPRFPDNLKLAVIRIDRDEDEIKEITEAVMLFDEQAEEQVAELRKRKPVEMEPA